MVGEVGMRKGGGWDLHATVGIGIRCETGARWDMMDGLITVYRPLLGRA